MTTTHSIFGFVAYLLMVAPLVGCDAVSEKLADPNVEEALRTAPGRGGKVGTLAALDIRRQSIRTARAMSRPVDPACDVTFRGGARVVKLDIERRQGDVTMMRWSETRRVSVRAETARLQWSADFQTLVGTRGTRSGEVIVVGDKGWVGRDPGPSFYRRDDLDATIVEGGVEELADLIHLATWKRDGPARWLAGDERLTCARRPKSAWAPRFDASHGALVEQRLEFSPDGTRRLSMEWDLPDGSRLALSWTGKPADFVAIGSPDGEAIVDVDRDLSYKTAVENLQQWLDDGLVQPVSVEEEP